MIGFLLVVFLVLFVAFWAFIGLGTLGIIGVSFASIPRILGFGRYSPARLKAEADLRLRERAEALHAKLEGHEAEARPHIQVFEQTILERFDCRPCPRCGELRMVVA